MILSNQTSKQQLNQHPLPHTTSLSIPENLEVDLVYISSG